MARLSVRYLQYQARITPVIRVISMAIILFILWIVSDDIASGQLRSGDIVSLMLYGMLLTQPISRLADTYGHTQRALTAAERLDSVFSAEGNSTPLAILCRRFGEKSTFPESLFPLPTVQNCSRISISRSTPAKL